MSDIKFPVVPKEVIDKVFPSDDGWTTVYEGPTIRMTKTVVLDTPLEYVSVDGTIPERTVVPDFPIVDDEVEMHEECTDDEFLVVEE